MHYRSNRIDARRELLKRCSEIFDLSESQTQIMLSGRHDRSLRINPLSGTPIQEILVETEKL